jgi:hypothetical protein
MSEGRAPQTDQVGGEQGDGSAAALTPADGTSAKPWTIRRFRAARLLVICGLLLCAAIISGTVGILVDLRDRALAASERELTNTALVLAEQTDRAFQAVELMQSGLIESMNARGIASAEDYERLMSGHDVHLMLRRRSPGWRISDRSPVNARQAVQLLPLLAAARSTSRIPNSTTPSNPTCD